MSQSVFISYCRDDDEPFAKQLHKNLTRAGFEVWWDRVSMPSRRLTFYQEIADAIRSHDRLILVVGPKAAVSASVRQEWQWALRLDKPITPILRKGDYTHLPGELSALQCDDFRDNAQYRIQLAKLVENLRRPEPPLGALFGVPSLPPHFLDRPDLLCQVKNALLADLKKPVVITASDARVGMHGMGGIGKSVLAAAIAHDREVRRSYPNGIIWLTIGQQPDLVRLQHDVARHLGSKEHFDTEPQGRGVLQQLLAQKAVLLVLDDVWQTSDAQAFDVLGPRCRTMVTTRDAGILHTLGGPSVAVALLTEQEALQLLADAVGVEPSALPPPAFEIVKKCEYLPLAVALCGGMVKKHGGDWTVVIERLRRADIEKIGDPQAIDERHRSVWRAMQVSVDVLPPDEQRRFAELTVFVRDNPVPEAAVATLWSHTGNLSDLDTTDLLMNLADHSLIRLHQKPATTGEPIERSVSLHDLLYDYATRLAGEGQALNEVLLAAYRKRCTHGWPTGPNDGYFYQNLAYHLHMAGLNDEFYALLTMTPEWMIQKTLKVGGDTSYLDDLQLAMADFAEPVEAPRFLAFVRLRVAQEVAKHRHGSSTDQELQILVLIGREQEALANAGMQERALDRLRGFLVVHSAHREAGKGDVALLETALKILDDIKDSSEWAEAHGALAVAFVASGRVNDGRKHIQDMKEACAGLKTFESNTFRLGAAKELVDIGQLPLAIDVLNGLDIEEYEECIEEPYALIRILARSGREKDAKIAAERLVQRTEDCASMSAEYDDETWHELRDIEIVRATIALAQGFQEAGRQQYATRLFAEAESKAREVYEPEAMYVQLELCLALTSVGRLDEAHRAASRFGHLISESPAGTFSKEIKVKQAKALSALAIALYEAGRTDECRGLLRQIRKIAKGIRNHGLAAEALQELALALARTSDLMGATRLLDLARERHGRESIDWRLATTMTACFEALHELGPQFSSRATMVFRCACEACLNIEMSGPARWALCHIGAAATLSHRDKAARSLLGRALEALHDDDTIFELPSSSELAIELARAGLFSKAHAVARKIKRDFYLLEAKSGIAALLSKAGRAQQAAKTFAFCRRLDKESFSAHLRAYVFAIDLARAGRLTEAREIAESVDDQAQRARALYWISARLFQMNRRSQAEEAFQAADRIDSEVHPSSVGVHTRARTAALFSRDRPVEALAAFRPSDLDDFIGMLSESSSAIGRIYPGSFYLVLLEAMRIVGWVRPDWCKLAQRLDAAG